MMKARNHYIFFGLTLLVTMVCAIMMPRVKVNSDMTRYLPDDSQMKQGLDILMTDFTASQMAQPEVHAMFPGLHQNERDVIQSLLLSYPDIQAVTYRASKDSLYTLYDIVVPKNIDQKKLGFAIREDFGPEVVVETSQDGATPPISALIIAGSLILIILIIMGKSWLDPLMILFTAGVAVVINIGTNALLPSVSITTNYIVAILQLVLSLDYSIVLMNRYRQEIQDQLPIVQSLNRAVRRSFKPIMSSALTTIVGLLMLAFMRLKIGMDMGVVLAKGVVCSLICTFTFLPSLLMLCHRGMLATHKATPLMPTNRISYLVTHHKVSMAILAVSLLVVSFIFSKQTDIYFSTNTESRIAEIFPKTNTTVMLYDTRDEMQVIALNDSLLRDTSTLSVISYPTLLKQTYTAEDLVHYIFQLGQDMSDYLPFDLSNPTLLTPHMMQLVYYMHSGASDTLHIPFPELMRFIESDCISNPLFASVIDDSMREQMGLLALLLDESAQEDILEATMVIPEPEPQTGSEIVSSIDPVAKADIPEIVVAKHAPDSNDIEIIPFCKQLAKTQPNELTQSLRLLTDTALLSQAMDVQQMSDFIGSTPGQTKIIYALYKTGKTMTPMQYVHFLTDDLFQRKALSKLVSKEQKQGLLVRQHFMDLAFLNASAPAQELSEWLQVIGLEMTDQQLIAMAKAQRPQPVAADTMALIPMVEEPVIVQSLSPLVQQPQPKRKTKQERQAELFDYLMHSTKAYSAEQTTRYFRRLGQAIDIQEVAMLYAYYGSIHHYDTTLTMSPEQVLAYVSDTLIHIPQAVEVLDPQTCQMIDSAQTMLSGFISMLAHDDYSMMIVVSNVPDESPATYAYIDRLDSLSQELLDHPCYKIGESVMFSEMKQGFNDEMRHITLLTILAIFLIVALSFRSLVVPTILVMTVMTAVYVNVIFSGIMSGHMLYLAYLIAQSILMGATIDYGILYTNYYKEYRRTMAQYEAAKEAYHGAIPTIMTSGLIMVLGPGVMALLVDDVAISAIVGCISIGAFVSIFLILTVLPGTLVALDRWVLGWWKKKK